MQRWVLTPGSARRDVEKLVFWDYTAEVHYV